MKLKASLQITILAGLFLFAFCTTTVFAQNASVTIRAVSVYSLHDARNESEDYRFKFWYQNTQGFDCLRAGGTHHTWIDVNYVVTFNSSIHINDEITLEAHAWEEDGCKESCDYNDTSVGCDDNFPCSRGPGTILVAPQGVPTGGKSFQLYNLEPGNVSTNYITISYCGGNYQVKYLITYMIHRPAAPALYVSGSPYVSPNTVCGNKPVALKANTFINPSFHPSVSLTWYYNVNGKTKIIRIKNPKYCGNNPKCEINDPPPACCFEPEYIDDTVTDWIYLGTSYNASDQSFDLNSLPEVRNSTGNGNIIFYAVASANGATSGDSPKSISMGFAPPPPGINGGAASNIVTGNSCLNTNTGSLIINNIVGTTNSYRYIGTKEGDSRGQEIGFNNSNLPLTISGVKDGTYTIELANGGGQFLSCFTSYPGIEIGVHPNPSVLATVYSNVSCPGGSNGRIDVSATGGNPNLDIEFSISPTAGNFVRIDSRSGYFENLPANTYSVTGVDRVAGSNCGNPSVQGNLVVSQPTQITGSYSNVISPDCSNPYNGQVTVSAGNSYSGTYNYRIYRNGILADDELGIAGTSVTFSNLQDGTYTVYVTDAARNACPGYASGGFPINAPVNLNLSLTEPAKNSTCFDADNGEIALTASGGSRTQDYFFSIENTTTGASYNSNSSNFVALNKSQVRFTSLAPGNYRASVKNADACLNYDVETNIIITEPNLITPSITKKEITCRNDDNGRLTLTSAIGGSGSFTYLWEYENRGTWEVYSANVTLIDNLEPGKYRLNIKERSNPSCAVYSGEYTFDNPSVITIGTPTFTHITCKGANDGTIQMNASGGWADFTYQYSADGTTYNSLLSVTKLPKGAYDLRATDKLGCIADYADQVTITEPAQILTATFSKHIYNDDYNISCQGENDGRITVTPTGGNGNPFLPGTYLYSVDGSDYQTSNMLGGLTAGARTIRVKDGRGCIFTDIVSLKEPEKLTISLVEKNYIKCFGNPTGFIEVSAAKGVPGYQFKIDAGAYSTTFKFESLLQGDYVITVRDRNGCTAVLNERMESPNPKLVVDFVQTNVSCFDAGDGKLTANVSGGDPGYSIAWIGRVETVNTITSLRPGTYTFKVTDSEGCSLEKSTVISQPLAPLSASLKTTHIRCFAETNGAVEAVNVAGGTVPYSYSINNGINYQTSPVFSGKAKGNYSITVKDANGCTVKHNATIIEPPVLSTSIASKKDILCFAGATGSIETKATGGIEPYRYSLDGTSYMLDKTFNLLTAQNYIVHVRDSFGCVRTANTTLIQPNAALSIKYTVTPVQCKGDANGKIETTLSGGTAPYNYSWQSLPHVTDDIDKLVAGAYHITATDDHGCTLGQDFIVPEPDIALGGSVEDQLNITCNTYSDGSFRIEPVGGYAPYTYSFNGSVYNAVNAYDRLIAGTYSVMVRDTMGCVAYVPAILTEPHPLIVNAKDIKNASCFGFNDGSFETVVTGGTEVYRYSIDNGTTFQDEPVFTSLIKNDYKVLVKDQNACTASMDVAITQPKILTATIKDVVNSSCGQQDGSGRVDALGGTQPYSYNWKRGSVDVSASGEPKLFAGFYEIRVTDFQGCIANVTQIIVDEDGPTTSISSSTDARCFNSLDGKATVTATGGAGSYTYLWSDGLAQLTPTANGLARGHYLATVTDARGCKSFSEITIGSPELIEIDITEKTLPLCYESCEGQINVIARGGVGSHTYQWLNTVQPNGTLAQKLCRGEYQVKVIDNVGCEQSFTIPLTTPEPLALTVNSVKLTTCAGGDDGSASVTASGGTEPYLYRWNDARAQTTPEAVNLEEGIFNVTVTDAHGCIVKHDVALDKIQPIAIDLGGSVMLCFEQRITLDAGIQNAVYTWKKDNASFSDKKTVTLTQAGVYTVDVTDTKGCKGFDTFTVRTSTRAFNANFLGASEMIAGDSLMLAEVCFPKPDSVQWGFGDGYKMLIDSPDQPQITYLQPGEYTIVMTGYYEECTDKIEKKVVFFKPEDRNRISGRAMFGESGFKRVHAYPNPSSGKIEIEIEMHREQPVALFLYNTQGRELYRSVDKDKFVYRFSFDLSDQVNGIYVARILTDGERKDVKIILTK